MYDSLVYSVLDSGSKSASRSLGRITPPSHHNGPDSMKPYTQEERVAGNNERGPVPIPNVICYAIAIDIEHALAANVTTRTNSTP